MNTILVEFGSIGFAGVEEEEEEEGGGGGGDVVDCFAPEFSPGFISPVLWAGLRRVPGARLNWAKEGSRHWSAVATETMTCHCMLVSTVHISRRIDEGVHTRCTLCSTANLRAIISSLSIYVVVVVEGVGGVIGF